MTGVIKNTVLTMIECLLRAQLSVPPAQQVTNTVHLTCEQIILIRGLLQLERERLKAEPCDEVQQ